MSLLTLNVINIHPHDPFNSVDKPIFVTASDGLDYVAKISDEKNPCLPIAESLSYFLCGRIGLAVPSHAWLTFDDGKIAFGSRLECGISQFTNLTINEKAEVLNACSKLIFQFCYLDAFIANNDRHFDNMLFRKSPLDFRWTVINMDFSRALWKGGFPSTTATDIFASGNTASTVRLLHGMGAFDSTIPLAIVASLDAITSEQISSHLSEAPSDSVCDEAKKLCEWWKSQERRDRASSLMGLIV